MADPESLVPRAAGAIDAERVRALRLAPADGLILSRVNGVASVSVLAATTGLQIEDVLASLLKLESLRLVVLSQASKAPPPADEAVEIDLQHQQQISTLFARLDETDHYALLGIDRSADKKEVKRAYFELTVRFHPDRFFRKKLGPFKAQMEAIFGRMSEAHETLTSDRRAEYDAYLGSIDRTRDVERMVDEATAEIRRVEEAALGVTVSSAPPPPPSSSNLGALIGDALGSKAGSKPASDPAPRRTSASPAASSPPDSQSRREMLARRLTGNAGRISSGSFRAPVAPKVPAIAYAKSEDAVDALKRRYEEKVSSAKESQAKKYADSGMAARAKGDVVAAANALRVAVTFDEKNAGLRAAYEEAQRAADELMAEQYLKQAGYEEKAEKWAEAARSWQRVARARPGDATAHERAADCLVRSNGNLHEASALAQRAVQLVPQSARARVVLASVYLAAGLTKNAKREIEAARAMSPNDAHVAALLKRIDKAE